MTPLTLPIELQLTPKSQALIALLRSFEPDQTAAEQPAQAAGNTLQPPAHGEYWPGQGGRYICTMPDLPGLPAHHLIAGTDETTLTFGPREDIAGTSSHTDGRANTAALLASGKPHPAAQWASQYTADGHTDFFLPSKLDLVMAHACARQHFETDGYHWASTQLSGNFAFVVGFEYGYSFWDHKDDEHRVRAFRRVQLDHLNT